MEATVRISQISDLMLHFAKHCYQARDNNAQAFEIEDICLKLFQLDYVCSVINNFNGELCNNYPTRIVVMEYEKDRPTLTSSTRDDDHATSYYSSIYDVQKIREQFAKARVARCRARFPLPVILYNGKHICRSSTLSGGPEIYGRSGLGMFFPGGEKSNESDEEHDDLTQSTSDWQLFDKVRNQDIKLLKLLCIKVICDLMVENKKVKFGMNITSSEKIDKEKRYADFNVIGLPYPGCEFFRVYRDCSYNAEGLIFDWKQSHIDTNIGVPLDPAIAQLGIDWSKYKTWDLIQLTQNYLRLILFYVNEGSSGILIHCISGWDRTPLFVSLLRLSLWADGKIHQSLGINEILYLTLAYDWFLCGHNLKDRLEKGEEILFFCFYFLKYIFSDDFSVNNRRRSFQQNNNNTVLDEYFDADHQPSKCGSNTSLSSNGSSFSYRSVENPPSIFTNPDSDGLDDCIHPKSSVHNRTSAAMDAGCSNSFIHMSRTCTSPVAVPAKMRKRSDSGSSAMSSGSWQIITASGSVRGSATTHEIWHASSSDASSHSRLSQTSLCDIIETEGNLESSTVTLMNESRKDRLSAVRNLFISQYCNFIKFHDKSDSDVSRFASLIDQFAEKVGIRSTINKPL
uniref:Tyrosine specific protein phosphatases domain-containing protein n=1 Tax=Strigamia maritima TaxID=126957 RepID=T1IQ34_STRMM